MTSDADYSIRRTIGTHEIAGLPAISDRKQQRRRDRRDRPGHEREHHDAVEEEAVQVELTEGRIEDAGQTVDEEKTDPPAPPAVDCLA